MGNQYSIIISAFLTISMLTFVAPTMKLIIFLSALLVLATYSCGESVASSAQEPKDTSTKLESGPWMFYMQLNDSTSLPFNVTIENDYTAVIRNGEEEIMVSDISWLEDTIVLRMPVFDSEFRLFAEHNTLNGYWYNHAKGDNYKIPVFANAAVSERWNCEESNQALSAKWEVQFSPDSDDSYPAVGIINTDKEVTGTFITETGDYRFLAGVFCDSVLKLSCFDGSHAFLFNAKLNSDGELSGYFYSGNHWSEPWLATPNPDAQIDDPFELTYLKEGYDGISFKLKNTSGETVSYPSDKFKNTVTIIQIMGSWCPNCMDETKMFTELHNAYNKDGLEIISVCYEKPDSYDSAVPNMLRIKEHFNSKYDFVYGGPASKSVANDSFPMLNHVMSFPTAIFIDKSGVIRKIHTGFYGPGTGEYHTKTRSMIENLVLSLLAE